MSLQNINAYVFYSYQVCPREAWLYFHHIDSSKEHPFLALGRLVHEMSYQRERKELFIDNLLKIDLIHNKLVAEVKKSSRHKRAALLQLGYYLYYLKHEKGIEMKGVLLFPKEKKRQDVELTAELEKEIQKLLEEMKQVLFSEKPPPAQRVRYCRVCAFYEFCWS
jgi:CRISPR-associated exonuclease Cas4